MELYSLLSQAHDLWDEKYSPYICDCLGEAEYRNGLPSHLPPQELAHIIEWVAEQIGHAFGVDRWLAYKLYDIPLDAHQWNEQQRRLFFNLGDEFYEQVTDFRKQLWQQIFDQWGQR